MCKNSGNNVNIVLKIYYKVSFIKQKEITGEASKWTGGNHLTYLIVELRLKQRWTKTVCKSYIFWQNRAQVKKNGRRKKKERESDTLLLGWPICPSVLDKIGLRLSKNLFWGTFCHHDLNILSHALIQNSLLLLTIGWISCGTKPFRNLPLEPSSLPLCGE